MTNESAEAVEKRHIEALKAFVLRARRAELHSLMRNPKRLMALANVQWTISFNAETQQATVIQDLPPEEQVESAAARVRPLILEDELTHHSKVTNAIGWFLHKQEASEQEKALLKGLVKDWKTIKPRGRDHRGYAVFIGNSDGTESTDAVDNVLGFSWIYGDVVHADPERREETEAFGVRERYRAAVPLVAHILILSLATLNLIKRLQKQGVIPELPRVFETDVIVTNPRFEEEAEVFVSDLDENGNVPPTPKGGEPFGEGWSRVYGAARVENNELPENESP